MHSVFEITGTKPCPKCVKLSDNGDLDHEAIMPLGKLAPALSIDGSGPCCPDCQAAENIVKFGILPEFLMARVAVGNDRLEHFRLPKGTRLGLVASSHMLPCSQDDLDRHISWLKIHGLRPLSSSSVRDKLVRIRDMDNDL